MLHLIDIRNYVMYKGLCSIGSASLCGCFRAVGCGKSPSLLEENQFCFNSNMCVCNRVKVPGLECAWISVGQTVAKRLVNGVDVGATRLAVVGRIAGIPGFGVERADSTLWDTILDQDVCVEEVAWHVGGGARSRMCLVIQSLSLACGSAEGWIVTAGIICLDANVGICASDRIVGSVDGGISEGNRASEVGQDWW